MYGIVCGPDGGFIACRCLSGIFRDVYILTRPGAAHISDYHVRTPLDFDAKGGLNAVHLDIDVDVSAEVRA